MRRKQAETRAGQRRLDEDSLAAVLSRPVGRKPSAAQAVEGIVIGRVAGTHDADHVLIDFDGSPSGTPQRASSTVAVAEEDIGREVALAFERGDPNRPVILGFVQKLQRPAKADSKETLSEPVSVELDGERLALTAAKEIVLRCGKASITLTKAGKVLIRGAYLLNRSSGVNRIKGGSVQIN